MLTINDSCNCLSSCDTTVYNVELNNFKSNVTDYMTIMNRVMKDIDMDSESESDSIDENIKYNQITVFYQKSKFSTSKKIAKVWWSDFLANCGGLLGLFMGVSISSIVEIFYVFIITPIHQKLNRNEKKNKMNDDDNDVGTELCE